MILNMLLYIHRGEEMEESKVILKKQPQKYLSKVDSHTYKKLRKALRGLGGMEGRYSENQRQFLLSP